jgi:hypothetical protein
MKYFQMTLRVSAKNLTTVMEVVAGAADLLELKQLAGDEPEEGPKKKNFSYANGQRNKGITGEELILQSLQKGALGSDAMCNVFASRGFAGHSFHAAASKLAKEGKIIKNGKGWELKV